MNCGFNLPHGVSNQFISERGVRNFPLGCGCHDAEHRPTDVARRTQEVSWLPWAHNIGRNINAATWSCSPCRAMLITIMLSV